MNLWHLKKNLVIPLPLHVSHYTANEASADPQPVHELEPPAAPTVVETRVQDEEPHTESGTTEEISPEEQPVEPEATAQDEETGNFNNILS